MATPAPRADLPALAIEPTKQLSRVLREVARTRTDGRCQWKGCSEPATFVTACMLAPLAHGAAGLTWSAVCVRHGAVFAMATSTPRPGA